MTAKNQMSLQGDRNLDLQFGYNINFTLIINWTQKDSAIEITAGCIIHVAGCRPEQLYNPVIWFQ